MAMVTMTGVCPRCGHNPEVRAEGVRFAFELLRKVPSMNDNSANYGGSRWAYSRQRNTWCILFRAARLDGKVTKATGKRDVTFTRLMGKGERLRDYDNLVGGMKLVVDAMRIEGLLVDDSPKWLQARYAQEHGSASGLRVEVTELGAGG